MAQDNKYLTFKMGDEKYALPILKIKEIIGSATLKSVRKKPKFIKGSMELRGSKVPVIDLGLKLEIADRKKQDRISVIVVDVVKDTETKVIGIIVDTLQEVLHIPLENIAEAPKYEVGVDRGLLSGIGKVNEDVIMLLDIDKLFTDEEKDILIAL